MNRARYIAILGPDGCGKTTVADHLAEVLAEQMIVRRMNFSFEILPPLSRILGRAPKEAAPEGQPNAGMVNPLRRTKALILGIWYGMDHVLGHFTLRRAQPGEVIIFARSYHDFLYQRAYLNLPRALPRLFLALGPKPDLIATPIREAAAIHEVKPELTIEEVSEQYSRIARGLQHYDYFALIDASLGVMDTVCRIRKRVGL